MKNTHIAGLKRRAFIKSGMMAVALTALPREFSTASPLTKKLKVVLTGTGSRGTSSWGTELIGPYQDYVEMVGLCDINHKRLAVAKEILGIDVKTYSSDEFDQMIAEQKPDFVIVTTTDSFHVDYIVRALELGCNVISEKPIATEADQCQRIHDAEKKSGRKVYVGFNVRHMNESMEMKRILDSGELGKIISIDYHEYLDTQHGASYFRRWHGKIKYSGSLLVHKSSHHFDLINWLLNADPVDVQAMGKTAFYGSNNKYRGKNCRECDHTQTCPFYWDMKNDLKAMKMYADCEDVDHYYRDGCVWDENIDSHDTASVQVSYDNGTLLTYTLNAYLPYEGQYICFSGEKGRLDVKLNYRQPWAVPGPVEFRLTKDAKTSRSWVVSPETGGHGGADERVKDMLFKPGQPDPAGQKAGSRAGILSSMIGIAARKSIETGQRVAIKDLINLD
ncbi:MAG: Gfo/Idh/MocA family oxidoreductase [Cyclobacteriaceae bacterium]|nr:Gfo/Idh/MocA family oxidoreductase [Cyclobacteriaceae bacterium]